MTLHNSAAVVATGYVPHMHATVAEPCGPNALEENDAPSVSRTMRPAHMGIVNVNATRSITHVRKSLSTSILMPCRDLVESLETIDDLKQENKRLVHVLRSLAESDEFNLDKHRDVADTLSRVFSMASSEKIRATLTL
jgi:hypothetical protein